MIILNQAEVNALLAEINDPKVKKAVKTLLQELQNTTPDPSKLVESSLRNKRLAKKALELICRGGIGLGEHALYSGILYLLLRLLD